MSKRPPTPQPAIWKLVSLVLFPFGNDSDWEPGTFPKWRNNAGQFWFAFVVMPTVLITAGWAFFELFPSSGGSYTDRGSSCYPYQCP